MSTLSWRAPSDDRTWIAVAAAFGIIAIGRALQILDGLLDPRALLWITSALIVTLAGIVLSRPIELSRIDARIVPLIAIVGLFANLGQLSMKPPILVVSLAPDALSGFNWRLGLLALAAGAAVWRSGGRARAAQIAALVGAHLLLGVWTIHQSPAPSIDVHVFQRRAIAALRNGHNPYELTYRNIYSDAPFYGPGLSVNGRLQFGFPYFPLSLVLAMPGQLLGGDHRYAQLVALEVAAILIACARPKGFGVIAAALLLTTPRIFFVLEQSWTEPFVIMGLAAVVFAASRNERAVPWLFGGFLAVKQYLVLALPPALLLVRQPRDALRFFGKALIVSAAVTIPFVVWNPRAFWRSVVALQFHQPFRVDALSYLSWWTLRGHPQPSQTVSFLAAAVASGICLWRAPRTAAGFSAALSLTFLAFFAFNKQAFCNYYFFVVGAFAATLAAYVPAQER